MCIIVILSFWNNEKIRKSVSKCLTQTSRENIACLAVLCLILSTIQGVAVSLTRAWTLDKTVMPGISDLWPSSDDFNNC